MIAKLDYKYFISVTKRGVFFPQIKIHIERNFHLVFSALSDNVKIKMKSIKSSIHLLFLGYVCNISRWIMNFRQNYRNCRLVSQQRYSRYCTLYKKWTGGKAETWARTVVLQIFDFVSKRVKRLIFCLRNAKKRERILLEKCACHDKST